MKILMFFFMLTWSALSPGGTQVYSSRAQPESSSSDADCREIRLAAAEAAATTAEFIAAAAAGVRFVLFVVGVVSMSCLVLVLLQLVLARPSFIIWLLSVAEVAPNGNMSELLLLSEDDELIIRLLWFIKWFEVLCIVLSIFVLIVVVVVLLVLGLLLLLIILLKVGVLLLLLFGVLSDGCCCCWLVWMVWWSSFEHLQLRQIFLNLYWNKKKRIQINICFNINRQV